MYPVTTTSSGSDVTVVPPLSMGPVGSPSGGHPGDVTPPPHFGDISNAPSPTSCPYSDEELRGILPEEFRPDAPPEPVQLSEEALHKAFDQLEPVHTPLGDEIREILDEAAAESQEDLETHQILTQQVQEWLRTKDPYKFFRKFLAGTCNKNLALDTWPQPMVESFNARFYPMVSDGIFVSEICKKIRTFQNGHLVAPHVAGAFVTVCAGILSFSLAEV